MKPSRGKRRGPYRPAAGFSPPARRRRSVAHLLAGARRASTRRAAAVLSAAGAPRPVRRRRETPGQGDRRFGVGAYRPGGRRPVDGPRTTVSRRRVDRRSCARVRLAGTGFGARGPRVRNGRTARRVARGQWRIGRQPVRPVLKHGPRSLTCARVVGRYETRRRNESEGPASRRPRWDPHLAAHHRPVSFVASKRRSKSVHVGTRKMVNYARVGRSQRKLWWRLAAILTCKSIVKLGYRGERLIEPSSSWFLSKFPSG